MVRIVNGELVDDSAPAPASGPLAFSSGMSMTAGMLRPPLSRVCPRPVRLACVRVRVNAREMRAHPCNSVRQCARMGLRWRRQARHKDAVNDVCVPLLRVRARRI